MKQTSKPFIFFGILTVVYLLLGLFLAPSVGTMKTYHLDNSGYHVLLLLIQLPLVLIWFAAFYGYAMLDNYCRLIQKAGEGKAFRYICSGLRWLAWGLPISSIISSILGALTNNHDWLYAPSIIINHYITLFFSLVAFSFLSYGASRLLLLMKLRPNIRASYILAAVFTIIGVFFCYFSLQSVHATRVNPYHLPLWLILLTIIIPYLYSWFMGLIAAYEIFLYSKHTKGLLYRRALGLLALGLLIIIVSSIGLQYIASDSGHLSKLTLNSLLLMIYVVLIVYGFGFLLTALGAKRLKKIEEV